MHDPSRGAHVTISVIQPGLLTTVQDLGRYGRQAEGVPVSGAMDTTALRCANMLVGNQRGAAGLEITIIGPTLRFERDALVALAGGELHGTLDGHSLPSWHVGLARAGSTLTFRGSPTGCHAYLAIAGGVDVPAVLGSRSTYLRGGFGGYDGRALRAGDVIPVGDASGPAAAVLASLGEKPGACAVSRWGVGPSLRAPRKNSATIRIVEGTHTHLLGDDSRRALVTDEFRISPKSDRMGYRLLGPRLDLREKVELLSEGVTLGTMQLPPGGSPIILMADRQTTGGYPRIGEVASVDIDRLAQLRPGDAVRFVHVGIDEAERLYRDREDDLGLLEAAIALRLSEPRGFF